MNQEPNEELISAYLDGEVDDAERARIEAWLAESAAARRLLAELRALSGALVALPRASLPESFAAQVMARATDEQASHRSPSRSVERAADGAVPTNSARPLATLWSRPGVRRGIVWAALATAAALLIMAFNADEPQQLSLVDDFATSAQKDKPAQPVPAAANVDLRKSAARSAGGDRATSIAAQPAPAGVLRMRRSEPAAKLNEPQSPADKKSDESTILGAMPDEPDLVTNPVGEAMPAAAPSDAASYAVTVGKESPALDNVLMVQCEVTPSAARRDLLGRVLAKEQVKVEDASTTEVEVTDRPNDAAMTAGGGVAASPAATIYLIDATAGQMRNVLANLNSATEGVVRLEVSPAPQDARQIPLANFNRSRQTKSLAPSQFGGNVTRRQLLSQALRNSMSQTNQALVESPAEEIAEEQVVTNELRNLAASDDQQRAVVEKLGAQTNNAKLGLAKRYSSAQISRMSQQVNQVDQKMAAQRSMPKATPEVGPSQQRISNGVLRDSAAAGLGGQNEAERVQAVIVLQVQPDAPPPATKARN